jgi:hypothetical protein
MVRSWVVAVGNAPQVFAFPTCIKRQNQPIAPCPDTTPGLRIMHHNKSQMPTSDNQHVRFVLTADPFFYSISLSGLWPGAFASRAL